MIHLTNNMYIYIYKVKILSNLCHLKQHISSFQRPSQLSCRTKPPQTCNKEKRTLPAAGQGKPGCIDIANTVAKKEHPAAVATHVKVNRINFLNLLIQPTRISFYYLKL